MKNILYLIISLLYILPVKSQPACFFTHYSSEEGLSQNTVMSILQDRKGNMWFSTWDGINKFNGYVFRTYKAKFDNRINLTNNRVDHMYEDKYGFLWLQTYDNQVYRFDTRSEKFEHVPATEEQGGRIVITSIKMLPCGSVWLLSENEGAIRVKTDPATYRLSSEWYSDKSGLLPATRVYDIYEDHAGNEWVLTNNGLGMLAAGNRTMASYFVETAKQEKGKGQFFYVAQEYGNEIFFGSDHGRIWRYQKQGGQFELLQLPASSRIVEIKKINEQAILIVTKTDGFFVYDVVSKGMEHYEASRLPKAPVRSVYMDKYSEIWFEQEVPGTVAHFNAKTKVLKTEVIPVEPTSTDRSRPAFHVHEDIYGTVWVHPYGGGFSRFDRENNRLQSFYNGLSDANWRFSNKIHSAFSDRQGNLWMCTHSKGLEKITFQASPFRMITPEPHRYESLSNEVRALCEDAEHNLWVGLKNGKLRVYGSDHSERGYLTEAGTISHTGTPLKGNVYFIYQDSKSNLWIATKGEGLVKAEPRNGMGYRLTRYRHRKEDIYSLSDDNVYCVYEDGRGRIWVATFGGGVNYLTHNQDGEEIFVSHRNNLKGFPIDKCHKVRFITGDHRENIWIATTVGALRVNGDFKNPEDAVFHHYQRIQDDMYSLSNNDVHWILSTGKKELYLPPLAAG